MQFYCQNTIQPKKDTKWCLNIFFNFYTKLAESSFLCHFRVESVNVLVCAMCFFFNKQFRTCANALPNEVTVLPGLPLLWNQRGKWLLFQVLTKEKWETTGRSGESTGRSQNISIINCTTFHIRRALSWHSYVIMYLLCIKVYSVVV